MERKHFFIGGIFLVVFALVVLFMGSPLGRVTLARGGLPYFNLDPREIALAFTSIFMVGFVLLSGGIINVDGMTERILLGFLMYIAASVLFGVLGVVSTHGTLSFGLFFDSTFIRFCLSWPHQLLAEFFGLAPMIL
ncbi:MAG: hypothetical protein HW403_131 [Dehalococcoidia bacterium]|nr:hypothetical protein [Dehalococcoidia bacterium]